LFFDKRNKIKGHLHEEHGEIQVYGFSGLPHVPKKVKKATYTRVLTLLLT